MTPASVDKDKIVGSAIDLSGLPGQFPTHRHEGAFWESLGRAVATFGFLEEVLAKAVFAFTATRPYDEKEIQQAYADWLPKLERALTDPLGKLIDAYGKAVREHKNATINDLDGGVRQHGISHSTHARNQNIAREFYQKDDHACQSNSCSDQGVFLRFPPLPPCPSFSRPG